MSASYHIFKNGRVIAITSTGLKTNVMHGNPAGEQGVIGKFGAKVKSSGPVSGR